MLLNILKYTEEHLTTNNYLVLHFNSAKVENTWPVKSSVLWSLPINPAECLLISSLTLLEPCSLLSGSLLPNFSLPKEPWSLLLPETVSPVPFQTESSIHKCARAEVCDTTKEAWQDSGHGYICRRAGDFTKGQWS